MPSVSVDFDKRHLAAVVKKLQDIKANIKKVLGSAINDTGKQARTVMSRNIREKVNIKKKDIDKYILFTRASPANLAGKLTLSKSHRLMLGYFGAKQVASGVRYRISKEGGSKIAKHAFIPPTLRGALNAHNLVFRRRGKARYPLTMPLRGPSPWGVFVKSGMIGPTKESIRANLRKNLDRRLKLELLRKSGQVKT